MAPTLQQRQGRVMLPRQVQNRAHPRPPLSCRQSQTQMRSSAAQSAARAARAVCCPSGCLQSAFLRLTQVRTGALAFNLLWASLPGSFGSLLRILALIALPLPCLIAAAELGSCTPAGKACSLARKRAVGWTEAGRPVWVPAEQYAVLYQAAGPLPSK